MDDNNSDIVDRPFMPVFVSSDQRLFSSRYIRERYSLEGEETKTDPVPRKRKRLTHLTPDERILRRKLKNRVAAQTARDRKKAKMTDLEVLVSELEEENRKLELENYRLQEFQQKTIKENIELKQRLAGMGEHFKSETSQENSVEVVTDQKESSRSAAPAVPLQKERQTQVLVAAMILKSIVYLVTLSKLNCWIFYKGLLTIPTRKNPTKELLTNQESQALVQRVPPPSIQTQQWWGPQQQSWNPSMNS